MLDGRIVSKSWRPELAHFDMQSNVVVYSLYSGSESSCDTAEPQMRWDIHQTPGALRLRPLLWVNRHFCVGSLYRREYKRFLMVIIIGKNESLLRQPSFLVCTNSEAP